MGRAREKYKFDKKNKASKGFEGILWKLGCQTPVTIAPYVEDAEENRQYFEKLKKIYVDIIHKNIDNVFMEELSMGMTGDYEVAISEGATYIRVGTGIFGERNYGSI